MRVNAPKDCSVTSNSLKQLHWIEDKEKKIFDLDFPTYLKQKSCKTLCAVL